MALICVGDLDEEKIAQLVNKCIKQDTPHGKITQVFPKEESEWEVKAKDLAGRFIKNFAKYTGNEAGKALVAAGPQL